MAVVSASMEARNNEARVRRTAGTHQLSLVRAQEVVFISGNPLSQSLLIPCPDQIAATNAAGRILIHPPSLKSPAPSPCEARAGRGLGRGARSIELSRSIEIPLPASPHFSVVGRGNRPRAWWWYQDAPLGARVEPPRFPR